MLLDQKKYSDFHRHLPSLVHAIAKVFKQARLPGKKSKVGGKMEKIGAVTVDSLYE